MHLRPEQAERDLGEVTVILRAWHANKDSDSVQIQNMRAREFAIGTRFMHDLVYVVQPERRLQLTIGDLAVTGSSFFKGAYDMLTPQSEELAPGSTLLIERADIYYDDTSRPPRPELYIGNHEMVALSAVAKTLREGGQLAIVEFVDAGCLDAATQANTQ